MLLAEGIANAADAEALTNVFASRLPLIHNLLEGGASPYRGVNELEPLGFKIALIAGAVVQTAARAIGDMLAAAREAGSTLELRDRMLLAPEMAKLVGAPALSEQARRWR